MIVEGERALGFLILEGLQRRDRVLELRRIVVDRKGHGTGRRALALALDLAFADHGAHRVWLDVVPENERARAAYATCGFSVQGAVDSSAVGGLSLLVMSLSAESWSARSPDVRRSASASAHPSKSWSQSA
jgi:diamine N-acetyltransferase